MQMRRVPTEHAAAPSPQRRPGIDAGGAESFVHRTGFSATHARFLRDPIRIAANSQETARNVEAPPRRQRATAVHSQPMQTIETQGCEVEGASANDSRDRSARAELVAELYRDAYHRVYAFVRRSVDAIEAEEIAHEAFIRLFRVRNLERMSVSVAYLLRIAENLLKRRHERATRYKFVLEESARVAAAARGEWVVDAGAAVPVAPLMGVRSDSVGAMVSGGMSAETVLAAMRERLTAEEQAAIRLIVCEGLDYQSAARSLGVPVSTINNWKHRGIAKLKQFVGCNGQPEPQRALTAAG